jgi:hypothetical protein
MTSITNISTGVARGLTVGLTLASLSAGLVGISAASASASPQGTAVAQRSGGDDDPAGDDHGGTRSGGDDRVIRTGSCSDGATWKLKVKTDDGRLEVEGEIDSDVVGERWRWMLRHDGSVSDRGVGTTGGRSGSFEVGRRMVDLAGTDVVVLRAVRDGQVCRGVVNY